MIQIINHFIVTNTSYFTNHITCHIQYLIRFITPGINLKLKYLS